MADKEAEMKQTSGKKGMIFIAVGMVLIIALLGVIAVLPLREEKEEEPKRNVVVNQNNAEEVAIEMISQEYIPPPVITALP